MRPQVPVWYEASRNGLTGVSCPATSNRMGVGWYYHASNNELPLFAPYNPSGPAAGARTASVRAPPVRRFR